MTPEEWRDLRKRQPGRHVGAPMPYETNYMSPWYDDLREVNRRLTGPDASPSRAQP